MVMLEVTQKPQPQQQLQQQQQQQQKRNVPPSLQKQPPTPRVSIKLTSAARRNAGTPAEGAKACAAPVPAATILRGSLAAHRESRNGNGYSDNGSGKDDYSLLEDEISFDDDDFQGSSSSPTACPFEVALQATELAQKAKDELCTAQLVTEQRKSTAGEIVRGIDVAWVQQLSLKTSKAVDAASRATAAAAAAAKDTTARENRQATASTTAGTAAGTCSQPTPNSSRPAMRKWRRMPRNANASAAAPPAGTTQTGEWGIPTTAGMAVHQKRGIDAASTMAIAAKPTLARKVSSDANKAALAMAGLTTLTATRLPAPAASETQAMRRIWTSGSCDRCSWLLARLFSRLPNDGGGGGGRGCIHGRNSLG
ncbi:unnamed protein product [Ectocarpus fasciculatus]